MDYDYTVDHDEDDLPVVSQPISSLTRRISNDSDDDEEENNHTNTTDKHQPNKSLGNWQNLYETSVHSLQSDDEDQRSTTQKPFYFDRPLAYDTPPEQRVRSPINQPEEEDLNTTKSRWEIRLPQLLNGTVGPDRQKRDMTRRHTTSIVFQRSDSQNNEFNPSFASQMSNGMEAHRSISPLVKQLKQKFDRMIQNSATNNGSRNPSNFQSGGPKLHRVTSLTCRGLTANTGEQLPRKPRPMLPIRPSTDINYVKSRTTSSTSLTSNTSTTNGRLPRNKAGPPVSYPKHFYPPPSTISVVKQLIGGGATLVYDSLTHQTTSNTTRPLIKHPINFEQTRKHLENQKVHLTGGQKLSNASDDIGGKVNQYVRGESKTDTLSGENIYEPVVSRRTTIDSTERGPAPPTRNENWDPAPTGNEVWNPAPTDDEVFEPNEELYYATYDENND